MQLLYKRNMGKGKATKSKKIGNGESEQKWVIVLSQIS